MPSYLHKFIDNTYHGYLLHQANEGLKALDKRIDAKSASAPQGAVVDHATAGPVCAPTPLPSTAPSAPVIPKAKKSKLDAAEQRVADLRQQLFDPDNVERDLYLEFLDKSLVHLRRVKSRSEFISDILHKLTDDTIQFDNDPYLFAFTNCVLDLRTNEFQENCDPLDFIRTTTGYAYNANQSPSRKKQLLVVLRKILPNHEHFNYYFTVLATGLCGIQMQNLTIANGEGGNGKSVVHQLMKDALGHYACVLPAICLMSPIAGGGNPELASLHKKRFVISSEPQKGKICSAAVKEITGNNELAVRQLYSNKVGAEMNLTLVLECNEKPDVDTVDDAVNRRMRMVNFGSKFQSPELFEFAKAAGLGEADNVYL